MLSEQDVLPRPRFALLPLQTRHPKSVGTKSIPESAGRDRAAAVAIAAIAADAGATPATGTGTAAGAAPATGTAVAETLSAGVG